MVGTTAGISKLHAQKLEAERVERIRAEERKAHAARTPEVLATDPTASVQASVPNKLRGVAGGG